MTKFFNHPVINHKVSSLRSISTDTAQFRSIVNEISAMMFYDVTKDLPTELVEITTPLCTTMQPKIAGRKLVIVPILRAGLGMVDGILSVMPEAKIGHIGLYRDEETLQPVEYFAKFPKNLNERTCVVVDPMLATGGSANMAIENLKSRGVTSIKLVCILGSPEGISLIEKNHPDVNIYLATLDEKLDENGYIVPGLGDAGDRIFGTK